MPEIQRQPRKLKKYMTRMPPPTQRYIDFVDAGLKFEDLDDEEVWKGQLKAANGQFMGRPPSSVPREFYVGMLKEQQRRFNDKLPDLVSQAFKTLEEIMAKKAPAPGDAARVKAATYVIDRFAGRVPETINMNQVVSVEKNYQDVMDAVLVDVDEPVDPTKEIEQ